ncbi:MAG TPA: hypothetical protein PK467_19105, partial [Candidatus Wallbacteria bacterium]|nr:hypothetical protein [Candidatus Wallbacteria bacterium]
GELEMYYEYFYDGRGNCVKVKCPPYLLADRETAILENTFKYDDFNRVTDIVYFNWLKVDNSRPDSLIRCVYGEAGLLKEIEIEPALLNPGKKYSFKYSYDFF